VQTLAGRGAFKRGAGTTGSEPLQISVSPTRGGGVANVTAFTGEPPGPVGGAGGELRGTAGGELNTVLTDATAGHVLAGIRWYPRAGQFYIQWWSGRRDALRPDHHSIRQLVHRPMNSGRDAAQAGLIKVTQGTASPRPWAGPGKPAAGGVDTAADSGGRPDGQLDGVSGRHDQSFEHEHVDGPWSRPGGDQTRLSWVTFSGTVQKSRRRARPARRGQVRDVSVTRSPFVTLTACRSSPGNNKTALGNATFGLAPGGAGEYEHWPGAFNVGRAVLGSGTGLRFSSTRWKSDSTGARV